MRSSYAGNPDVCVSKCLTVILLPYAGKPGKNFVELVVERNLAAIDEQHHGRRGELLRDAGHSEIRLGRAGRLAFDVGQSASVLENDLAIVDRHHASADVRRQRRFNLLSKFRPYRSAIAIVALKRVSNALN